MKMPPRSTDTQPATANEAVTFCVVAGSAILFCSKGVVVKLAYRHDVDALTVLTLRMAFALPFFLGMIILSSRGASRLGAKELARLAGLGFLGYYLSSLVNFSGLQYVSVGLERVILYTYPTLILAFSSVVLRKPVSRPLWLACLGAWLGILAAFAGELRNPLPSGRTSLGAGLIFLSAVTYAAFLMLSGDTIRRVGAFRFTGIVVGFSCVFIISHFAITRPIRSLEGLPPAVYGEGVVLALLGTVAPSILMSHGLKRAGPQRFAVISAIGPVTTILLAWALLGEQANAGQAVGFLLTLGSGLAVSLLRHKPSPPAEPSPVLDPATADVARE